MGSSTFDETNEFEVTAERLIALRAAAIDDGWVVEDGNLFVDGLPIVRRDWREYDVLGARFELDGEVVGLHVYPAAAAACLSVSSEQPPRSMLLLRHFAKVLGDSVFIEVERGLPEDD